MERKKEQAAKTGAKLERDFYDGKAVGVFDLSAFGYANADLSALKAVFDLLQVIIRKSGTLWTESAYLHRAIHHSK